MAFIKIENNVVVQKQGYPEKGLVEAYNEVVCGMIHNGEDTFEEDDFSAPPPVVLWEDVRRCQKEKIGEVEWRALRYMHQQANDTQTTETQAEYYAILDYMQDIRDYDEGHYDTPEDAILALELLEKP